MKSCRKSWGRLISGYKEFFQSPKYPTSDPMYHIDDEFIGDDDVYSDDGWDYYADLHPVQVPKTTYDLYTLVSMILDHIWTWFLGEGATYIMPVYMVLVWRLTRWSQFISYRASAMHQWCSRQRHCPSSPMSPPRWVTAATVDWRDVGESKSWPWMGVHL